MRPGDGRAKRIPFFLLECEPAVYARGWPNTKWAVSPLNLMAPRYGGTRVSFELEEVNAKLPWNSWVPCLHSAEEVNP